MAEMMRGVLFPGSKKAVIEEFPTQKPGVGEVLLEMRASGLCGSDLEYLYIVPEKDRGKPRLGMIAPPDIITGHEPCGVVAELGGGVQHLSVGDRVMEGHESCQACPVRCKPVVHARGNLDTRYGGPEYENLGSLGSNCGVDDLGAICKANEVCNKYGMDAISTGVTIAFAMECYENGILTKKDTDGIDLRFGNAEALVRMSEKIAQRDGLGDILAEGSWRAAEHFGTGAEEFSMTVKKQELPAHEPRGKWGVGLGYAVSPTGADHLQAAHDTWFDRPPVPGEEFTYIHVSDMWPFGVFDPLKAESLSPEKVSMFVFLQYWWSLHNVLDLCIFVSSPEYRMTGLSHLASVVRTVTGWTVNEWELIKAGERGITMARAFNSREGFTRQDDGLPKRLFEPIEHTGGVRNGIDQDEFEQALSLYYQIMGWDEEGIPQRWKLIELGLPWIS